MTVTLSVAFAMPLRRRAASGVSLMRRCAVPAGTRCVSVPSAIVRAGLPCAAGRRAVSRATSFVEPVATLTLSGKPVFASLPA